MAEFEQAPTVPDLASWAKIVKRADGSQAIEFSQAFYRFLVGERGRVTNINSGQASLVAAQQQAEANAQASAQANAQAAAAAIVASGSLTSDYDTAEEQTVSSGSFVTFVTNDLTQTGGGNYTITGVLQVTTITEDAAVPGGTGIFNGGYQIIENPNAHVLASGTFTVISSLNGGEGGSPFYSNSIVLTPALPNATSYGDNETGAVTIELQLRRVSGGASVSNLQMSLLSQWA